MQTFLPYPDFVRSAACLDRQRLGKQRVECKQIYCALTIDGYGWQNHPAVTMWRGHKEAVAQYGLTCCREWLRRGYRDSMCNWFLARCKQYTLPEWWHNDEVLSAVCESHRSNLVFKDSLHYGELWPDVPVSLDYVWPV